MLSTHSASRFCAVLITVVLLGSACGGDADGTKALSEAELCDKIASLESTMSDNSDTTAMLAVLADLADSAPTTELRNAIKTLTPILEQLDGIDESDPDAISKAMGIMMDPKVIAAGSVLEKFTTETCGLTETTDPPSDELSGDTVDGTGDIFVDTSAGEISDYVDANGADYFPNGYVSSTSISGAGDTPEVIVDIADADSIEGVALCRLISEYISASTSDAPVRIVIQKDTVDIAVREVDGECTPV